MSENFSNKIRLALLGKNIQHSKSPEIYHAMFGARLHYKLFDIQKEDDIPALDEIMNGLDGLSITSPYKSHFVDEIACDEVSKKLGGTNCIRKNNSRYEGTITDYHAFKFIYLKSLSFYQGKVIILGDGMMSKLVQFVLDELGRQYIILSRSIGSLSETIDLSHFGHSLIVNCCAREFVFSGNMAAGAGFFDFNYSHPHQKLFKQKSEINFIPGDELLQMQAQFAVKYWGINA